MPALDNLRHERFCRAFIQTNVAARAYVKAGYTNTSRTSLDTCASRLLRHAQVKRRIGELKRQMAARNRITVDSLVEELDEARVDARRLDQPSVAVSATMSKARLVGLLVDRKETGAPGEFASMQTQEQVLDAIRAELGEDAANALAAVLGKPELPAEAEPAPTEPEPIATREPGETLQ